MKPRIYLCRNKNVNIRLKSSSGGIFYELAAWTINQKGAVFGAAFNKNWGVDIIKIDKIKDIEKLMGSKYTLANINNTYQEAKKELENGRLVLFSATPCQVAGLKQYLSKDYNNLFCVEVVCHGTVPQHIWCDYLKILKRDNVRIAKINFRDKTYGWKHHSFRVDYDDGKTFIEPNSRNRYMQLFLKNHHLLPSCYHCRFKNKNTYADITIGDFWGLHGIRYKKFNDDLGTSIVRANNKNGEKILEAIDEKIEKKPLSKYRASANNSGWVSKIREEKEEYNSNLFEDKIKNIAVITLPLRTNIGGILQAYALRTYLKEQGFNVTFPQFEYRDTLQFVYDNINIKRLKCRLGRFWAIKRNEFDAIIAGSDQIWRKSFILGNTGGYYLDFTRNWNIRRIAYSTSFGVDEWDYSKLKTRFAKKWSSKFDRVSVREETGVNFCEQHLGIHAVVTVDPTLLFDSTFYFNECKNIPHKDGFFAYILDTNKNIKSALNTISNRTKTPIYSYNKKDVKDWLACFRDAKFIVTDSYHGCLFSINFNKPFVCVANIRRGNGRFNHLIKTYGIQNRIFDSFDNINYSMLNIKPNLLSKVEAFRKESVEYLKESLSTPLLIKTKELLE